MPAFNSAQESMANTQRGRCSGDVPGDTQRNLNVQNQFSYVTFKHVLLPIWIAAYRYNGKPYQFLVNGQTGEVVGVDQVNPGVVENLPSSLPIRNRPEANESLLRMRLFDQLFELRRFLHTHRPFAIPGER